LLASISDRRAQTPFDSWMALLQICRMM